MLLGKEELHDRSIDENDEILFTGLFDWDPGAQELPHCPTRHGGPWLGG